MFEKCIKIISRNQDVLHISQVSGRCKTHSITTVLQSLHFKESFLENDFWKIVVKKKVFIERKN